MGLRLLCVSSPQQPDGMTCCSVYVVVPCMCGVCGEAWGLNPSSGDESLLEFSKFHLKVSWSELQRLSLVIVLVKVHSSFLEQ